MLYVQKDCSWITHSLRHDFHFLEHSLQLFFKMSLSYAQTNYRLARFLIVLWKANEFYGVKNIAHLPLFNVYEGKWTIKASKIWKVPYIDFILVLVFTICFIFRLRLICTICCLVLMTCSLFLFYFGVSFI
jgi:hypothetical protein